MVIAVMQGAWTLCRLDNRLADPQVTHWRRDESVEGRENHLLVQVRGHAALGVLLRMLLLLSHGCCSLHKERCSFSQP